MGQGYSLTTLSAGSAGIDVPELSDLTYEKSLGNARFMKCIRARSKDGLVVVKVVMKPYASLQLNKYIKILLAERQALAEIPNTFGYHRIIETSTNGYLVRQWIYSSLYDRISTRPFLEDIEKKWLSFQLLCAVRDCHARNIYHGDIKSENILVTSWNWLYLCDFSSSFKPTYLPEDNPADFSFFFDTSGRRTCYLAPERFLRPGEDSAGKSPINWAMDIFSVGCVIAELFLESPIFSLSQLFKYRADKEYDPAQLQLGRIIDKDVRDMVSRMIALDPQSRYSAEEHLQFGRGRVFPDYFYGFLHQYMHLITDPSSGQSPLTAGRENLGEADDRIDRVYQDFEKVSYFLAYGGAGPQDGADRPLARLDNQIFPLQIDIPNDRHQASRRSDKTEDDGTLIFLTLVVASLRSTARATARLRGCELLLAFAERVTDEAKLDRIVPYLVSLLNDKTDAVKVAAIRTITQVLGLVKVVSPTNANIIPDYLLPKFEPFIAGAAANPSPWVRATYASCLATLATTASRFLEMIQSLRAHRVVPINDLESEGGGFSSSVYQALYDSARDILVTQIEAQVTHILTDTDIAVRRAFLSSVGTLCVFFGSTKASDVLLSHLNTYLNDKDWQLRCDFFETIIGVATYTGSASFEEFILPLMVQALTDPEEAVVERVIRSLSAIADLGLFQRSRAWELIDLIGRFLIHPNAWIREAAAQFVASSNSYLSIADSHSIVIPSIRPYLKVLPTDFEELTLLDALVKPFPRLVYEMVLTWASNTGKSHFWKPVVQRRTMSFNAAIESSPKIPRRDLTSDALARIPHNDDDNAWLKRLRNAGMTADDEFKLLALREYIWRVAQRRLQADLDAEEMKLNGIVTLKDLDIAPQVVFFEQDEDIMRYTYAQRKGDHSRGPTIAEALQDATKEIDLQRRASIVSGTETSQSPRSKAIEIKSSSARAQSPLASPSVATFGSSLPARTRTKDLSTLNADAISLMGDHDHQMVRKGSMLSLVGRGEAKSKALAEISTTPMNAVGQIDNAVTRVGSPLSVLSDGFKKLDSVAQRRIAHNYQGHDPNVLKLLDSIYLDNFPMDMIEFGPLITPSKRQPIAKASGPTSGYWKPDGILIAMLAEHTAAINRIAVAPDHSFFITGSDDGSVKVWNTSRLERNVSHKPRKSHRHAPSVRVTSLTFIENTHCFISAGSDGSIHIVKVDPGDTTRSSSIRPLREHYLPDNQYAVWIEHYKAETRSILIVATNKSRILALDLRTMEPAFELHNPVHHGTPTCFCIDKRHHWLLVGTSHGVLDLWDLRFRLRLKAWVFSGGSPIHRICLSPGRSSKRNRVTIAGGTNTPEITTWDLEKTTLRETWDAEKNPLKELFRTSAITQKESDKLPRLIELDDDRPGSMLERFHPADLNDGAAVPSTFPPADRGVRALVVGSHHTDDGREPRFHFLVSAGPDWKVRFWDPRAEGASCVVNGLGVGEAPPSYSIAERSGELVVVSEVAAEGGAGAPGTPSRGSGLTPLRKASGRVPVVQPGGQGRSSVISAAQQQLLRNHMDVIEDVAVVESPYGMIVSADRAGVVYVYA